MKKNQLDGLSTSQMWSLFVGAAKEAATHQGYALQREPGRGLSNVYQVTKGGKTQKASIRTTRDRWIAYHPLDKGQQWKTLDDVELVIVAAVDAVDAPQNIEVYIFPAGEVRKRFARAYEARIADGQAQKDNFGMWVGLDKDPRGIAASVGSGITEKYKPVAVYSIQDLRAKMGTETKVDPPAPVDPVGAVATAPQTASFSTIAEVLSWARESVASIAGVEVSAVKLDLRLSSDS